MNLKHLYYFWKVATHGGVARASEAIHVSPQTLSGQIKLLEARLGKTLFARHGRSLELTDAGKLALEYADEIFSLGAELDQLIRGMPERRPPDFRVGVSDALPKAIVYRLLRPAIVLQKRGRIICREWRIDRLLAELALHRLDMVISDSPVPPNVDAGVFAHKLGESGLSFLVHPDMLRAVTEPFPRCLGQIPLLMPGEDSSMRRRLLEWLRMKRLRVNVAGEFDDAALMAAFGGERVGAFPVPSVLVDDYLASGDLVLLGRAEHTSIEYFALSVQRRLSHPCVVAVASQSNATLQKSTKAGAVPAISEAGNSPRGQRRSAGNAAVRAHPATKAPARAGRHSSVKKSTGRA